MEFRPLGQTGIRISAVSFGAGPVPALLTKSGQDAAQLETIRRALDAGINWFDTAAGYGEGRSESALGTALYALGAADGVHVATKVRLLPEHLENIAESVRRSVEGSFARLRVKRISLLQVHNSITQKRGALPTSITPKDLLGPRGMLEAFRQLRDEGLVGHFGLTGLGDADALCEALDSGEFATIQLPYNLLIPRLTPAPDDGPILELCRHRGVAVLAIRVLAGGALALQPPSDYTRQTKFFPLDLYESDRKRAENLASRIADGFSLPEVAVRFVLSRPGIASALIGFANRQQLDEAIRFAGKGPLSEAQYLPLLAAE